jgi:hypothetical protein
MSNTIPSSVFSSKAFQMYRNIITDLINSPADILEKEQNLMFITRNSAKNRFGLTDKNFEQAGLGKHHQYPWLVVQQLIIDKYKLSNTHQINVNQIALIEQQIAVKKQQRKQAKEAKLRAIPK